MFSQSDSQWMELALENARKAAEQGEVPVGAVLVSEGKLLAQGFNQSIGLNDPTAHAEIQVLRKAAQLVKNYRLPGTELFVTIEPCLMCAGALVHARVNRLVFGAFESKSGAVCSHFHVYDDDCLNHQVKVEQGLLEQKCSTLLSEFFKARRTRN